MHCRLLRIGGCPKLGIRLYMEEEEEVFTSKAVAPPSRRRHFRFRPDQARFYPGQSEKEFSSTSLSAQRCMLTRE